MPVDLVVMAEGCGGCGPTLAGDLNGDGMVGVADLVILSATYGHALPA